MSPPTYYYIRLGFLSVSPTNSSVTRFEKAAAGNLVDTETGKEGGKGGTWAHPSGRFCRSSVGHFSMLTDATGTT